VRDRARTRSSAGPARSRAGRARPRATSSSAGEKIASGDRVSIWLASANRDEAAFDAPTASTSRARRIRTRVRRRRRHYCLGSHLAHRQVRVLFEELFAARARSSSPDAPRWTVSGLHNNVPCSLGHVALRVTA
jgi:cytochrome P450